MMTGEQLGVGHEPRHGTAYVSSWIKALENDPKEIRPAAVDAQRNVGLPSRTRTGPHPGGRAGGEKSGYGSAATPIDPVSIGYSVSRHRQNSLAP